jgi:hypothetical protein
MAMGDVTGVNRYEKGATIGSGTFGIVFKAIDKLVLGFLSLPREFWFLGCQLCDTGI